MRKSPNELGSKFGRVMLSRALTGGFFKGRPTIKGRMVCGEKVSNRSMLEVMKIIGMPHGDRVRFSTVMKRSFFSGVSIGVIQVSSL